MFSKIAPTSEHPPLHGAYTNINSTQSEDANIKFLERIFVPSRLYKLCSVGIRGFVLSLLLQCLSNRSQHVIVDSCKSKLVNVVSGVPQSSVLGALLFLLYASELFFHSGE